MENNTPIQLPAEVVEFLDSLLTGFSLLYYNSLNKDIANDSSEYINDNVLLKENPLTAYATKLHQLQQENESLTNQLKKQNDVQVENLKLLRKENEEAKGLLKLAFQEYKSGLLADRRIYEKIKKFLYGE